MPMKRCRNMAVIINIELDAVSGKITSIFHRVLRAIHNDFRSHRDKRMIGIHSQRVICCWINSACCRSTRPLTTANGAVTVTTGRYCSEGFSHTNGFRLCHGFIGCAASQAVLSIEYLTKKTFYLIQGVIFIQHCQKCRKLPRIMADFIYSQADFIIIVVSLHPSDFRTQFFFHFTVIVFRTTNIFVFRSIGSTNNYLRSTLKHGSTRGKHTGDNHKKQSCHQNKQNGFGVRRTKLRHLFRNCLGSLGCFFRTLGSCCFRSAVTGFSSCVFFLDCLFLPPAGKRVGTGIRIVLLELLIKGIHIGFI